MVPVPLPLDSLEHIRTESASFPSKCLFPPGTTCGSARARVRRRARSASSNISKLSSLPSSLFIRLPCHNASSNTRIFSPIVSSKPRLSCFTFQRQFQAKLLEQPGSAARRRYIARLAAIQSSSQLFSGIEFVGIMLMDLYLTAPLSALPSPFFFPTIYTLSPPGA